MDDADPDAGTPTPGLIDEASHAESFRRVRDARRAELVEDYVELIAELIDTEGGARQVDVARRLGVAQPTVAKMVRRLEDEALVTRAAASRGIALTEAGRELAEEARRRHQIVERFLLALGVEPQVARGDAEGIEHHVSRETLRAFERFLDGR